MRDLSAWTGEGRIKYRQIVVEGLENAPRALIGLLRGENFGRLLVRVARQVATDYGADAVVQSTLKQVDIERVLCSPRLRSARAGA